METIWMEHPIDGQKIPRWAAPEAMCAPAIRRRRFWCANARREVEVEFEARGFPGFRWLTGVRSCPVFDPPTGVACGRACLDARFRRRWEYALPIRTKPDEP
jgi:hypothetical protein